MSNRETQAAQPLTRAQEFDRATERFIAINHQFEQIASHWEEARKELNVARQCLYEQISETDPDRISVVAPVYNAEADAVRPQTGISAQVAAQRANAAAFLAQGAR